MAECGKNDILENDILENDIPENDIPVIEYIIYSKIMHEIVYEIDDEILCPKIIFPTLINLKYGSLKHCKILDNTSVTITNNDIINYLETMTNDNMTCVISTNMNGYILLDCDNSMFCNNPDDIRHKFDMYIYLYRLFNNTMWKKICIGYVYYYVKCTDDGNYNIVTKYDILLCTEEYTRYPGDHFVIEGLNDNIDIDEMEYEVVYPKNIVKKIIYFNYNSSIDEIEISDDEDENYCINDILFI